MYCKHCGKEITDNSKFCQYCGSSQEESTKSSHNDKHDSKQEKDIEKLSTKANSSNSIQWWIIIYCIWILLNLYCLSGDKYGNANSFFLPFADCNWLMAYDYTEFIVYVVVVPLFIFALEYSPPSKKV